MIVGFHGTTYNKANIILEQQDFHFSRGNRHWLGDGAYFFSEDLQAYIWNRNKYIHVNGNDTVNIDELVKQYYILSADIQNNRTFDLDTATHKLMFEAAFNRVCKLNKSNCIEGTVLNLMFNCMGYNDHFDLVIATFIVKYNRYDKMIPNIRLNGIPQKQICVKKKHIISNIKLEKLNGRAKAFESCALAIEGKWTYNSEQKQLYTT